MKYLWFIKELKFGKILKMLIKSAQQVAYKFAVITYSIFTQSNLSQIASPSVLAYKYFDKV